MQQLLRVDPPSPHDPRGWGQLVKIKLFQNMVMLHIKLNAITKCNNIVAKFVGGFGQKVTIKLFQNMVLLQIQLNGTMKFSNMVANSLPPDPPPATTLGGWDQKVKFQLFRTRSCCISN